jgi:hypothetical protein
MIDFVLPRRAVPMQLVAGEGHYDLVVGSVLAAQCSVWIATANLLGAKAGGRRNFELGLVTDDPLYLDQVQGIHDRIWRGLECHGCKRREICEAPPDTHLG